jgi:hypothetical protein
MAAGYSRPRSRWFSAAVSGKGKARWGRVVADGWVCRKVDDILVFLMFRAKVANLICAGDVILGSNEVIIGEQSSPGLCDLKARLSEMVLMTKLSAEEKAQFRAKRYADDGVRALAVDGGVSSREVADAVKEKMDSAYAGIHVTDEGLATARGGSLEVLEFSVGVQSCGRRLWWHHRSKNVESVLAGRGQNVRRLRHWRSGTVQRELLKVVGGRMDSMAWLTRADSDGAGGVRGAGDFRRDLKISVVELFLELVLVLDYPMSKLIQWIKEMCRSWYVWDEVVVVLQRMSDLLAVMKKTAKV